MRLVTLAAASVLALGALLGGFTALCGVTASVPQHTAAAAISVSGNNNGNG